MNTQINGNGNGNGRGERKGRKNLLLYLFSESSLITNLFTFIFTVLNSVQFNKWKASTTFAFLSRLSQSNRSNVSNPNEKKPNELKGYIDNIINNDTPDDKENAKAQPTSTSQKSEKKSHAKERWELMSAAAKPKSPHDSNVQNGIQIISPEDIEHELNSYVPNQIGDGLMHQPTWDSTSSMPDMKAVPLVQLKQKRAPKDPVKKDEKSQEEIAFVPRIIGIELSEDESDAENKSQENEKNEDDSVIERFFKSIWG